jgi:hypothetical protein
MLLSTLLSTTLALAGVTSAQGYDVPLSAPLQSILYNARNSSLTRYPTQLTQGIIPIAIHSHNDYWRPVPFYSALSVGAYSIEADVWLLNGTLYVGHEISALTPARTFHSLYIAPLLDTLRRQNPNTTFVSSASTRNGVYDTASTQTLYLFVDVKTDGPTTWPAVISALQPLRSAGFLARVENGSSSIVPGAVTVIGTGNTPLNQIQGVSPRDYFYDAPIPTLNSTFANITAAVSPIASTNFAAQFGDVRNQTFNASQLALLQAQVKTAHSKGIMVRYWNQPGWPVGTRNAVWRTLWDAGVDLLNVDDLEGVVNFWENRG